MKHLLYIFFFIGFLGSTGVVASQESSTHIEATNLLQLPQTTTDLDLAVSITDNKTITQISSSITTAETWLKKNVLSLYPSTKITTIVIFSPDPHKPTSDLILPSIKNLHHSLKRWGLDKNIKVSYALSYKKNPKTLETLKPIVTFLHTVNSTFTINPPLDHLDLGELGSLHFKTVNVLNPTMPSTRRNLRSLSTKMTTLPSPPLPTNPIPPCYPPPTPPAKKVEGLWCVAKPSVATETLQQSLDFACGEGGADCDEIKPHGICYYPDTTVAHASYAFNSYWQKTKRNGGTCSFGGTAMLITTDPSYQHCRFVLS